MKQTKMKGLQPTGVVLLVCLEVLLLFYVSLTQWTALVTSTFPGTVWSRAHTRLPRSVLGADRQHRLNFERWSNSSDALERLHVFEDTLTGVDLVWAQHSLNPDILARGKFQQQQTDLFCSGHNISRTLPSDPHDLSVLLKHLLYDDSKRLVVCYVPKNGCSNVKHMMLVLSGDLSPNSTRPGMARPPESVLKQAHSFINLSTSEISWRLESYHKVVIVRHPLTRLLSAYRNKLELPLNMKRSHSFPESIKLKILQRFRRKEFQHFMKDSNRSQISPTFTEFLQYMTMWPFTAYNEHFMAVLTLCQPCAIRYNFYANFKTLKYDMYATMGMLGIPPSYYPTRLGHRSYSTDDNLATYYSKVSQEVRRKVLEVFRDELEFYSALYPEESALHKLL